ncbi:MAG: outer membrane lipoprotein chaperone LolA [Woeseiaceae bacterium]|jgi:outer membrane lipoprotein carrier protein|nr:outer membrane lipoprotein chaperone LolA [Woeseiaceae bacterium]
MTRQIILLITLALGANGAFAQVSIDDLGEKLVKDFLTDVITLEGRFEQSLIDAGGAIIERTSGTLEIERPMRFRWLYTEPYEQWLVADGVNIWSYDLDLEQVTVKAQAEALANTPALLLGGSANALEQFDFGGTTVEKIITWVRLEPKDKNSGFNRVELGFIENQMLRMMFFDNLKQTTLIALHNVKRNELIDAARFEFVVPDGVDLVGTPAVAETADH